MATSCKRRRICSARSEPADQQRGGGTIPIDLRGMGPRPRANTTRHTGKMMMTTSAGIAEFEQDLIRERTGTGRAAAKRRGVRFGRLRNSAPIWSRL